MAELAQEGFLDTLKSSIKTSKAGAKARAAGDWFREKVKQASAKKKKLIPHKIGSCSCASKFVWYPSSSCCLVFFRVSFFCRELRGK